MPFVLKCAYTSPFSNNGCSKPAIGTYGGVLSHSVRTPLCAFHVAEFCCDTTECDATGEMKVDCGCWNEVYCMKEGVELDRMIESIPKLQKCKTDKLDEMERAVYYHTGGGGPETGILRIYNTDTEEELALYSLSRSWFEPWTVKRLHNSILDFWLYHHDEDTHTKYVRLRKADEDE